MMNITSNREYHTALAEIETFIEKGFGKLSKKETAKLEQISLSVEAYEKNKYLMPEIINGKKKPENSAHLKLTTCKKTND